MVRIVRGTNGTKNPWYETSMVRIVYGTKSPAITKIVDTLIGTGGPAGP